MIVEVLMIDGRALHPEALELLDALMTRLSASVALQDVQRREAHIRMSDHWFSYSTSRQETPIGLFAPDAHIVSARINWRWRLWAATQGTLPPIASLLMLRRAANLGRFLPAEEMPDVPSSPGGGGGSSSPAHLGIPVSWARKITN